MPDISKHEIKLFYCYAREDKALRDELEKHLSALRRQYHLTNWHDREILPGEEWENAIDSNLNTAHIILLLISPDFIASEYCYGKEMLKALERHHAGTCTVVPILLRPAFWEDAPFSQLQLLPTNARPITRWPDRDEAFEDVAREISRTINNLVISLKTREDWLEDAKAHCNHKRYEEAIMAYDRAILLDSQCVEAYQEKGRILQTLKRYSEALTAFEQVIQLNPTSALPHVMKGDVLTALHRYNEALTIFEYAINLDPSFSNAYIGRDKVLQQLGVSRAAQEKLANELQQMRLKLADEQKRSEELAYALSHTPRLKDLVTCLYCKYENPKYDKDPLYCQNCGTKNPGRRSPLADSFAL